MDLDEYILAFRTLSRCPDLEPTLQAHARHLYICLALDLPSATQARQVLLEEAQHKKLRTCGPNVSEVFEAKLIEKLSTYPLGAHPPEECLKELTQVLIDLKYTLIDVENPLFSIYDPFCRCACNHRNLSTANGEFFFRYISLDVFENHILFPGKSGTIAVPIKNRRFFYSRERIERLTQAPSLFGLERDNRIPLGRPPEEIKGKKIQSIVFLVPADSAPHRKSNDAKFIASQLGLPDYLKWPQKDDRHNQGFAVLRFHPDIHDPLYRPTIIDALEHLAFRPGPPDNGNAPLFRHGWTRVFREGELKDDEATIEDELGCKEVIMPSRGERFPSEALELETVCFFES